MTRMRKQMRRSQNPSKDTSTTIVYRGPVTASSDAKTRLLLATDVTLVSTAAGGTISGAITTAGVSSVQDWAQYQAIFVEYRVLGLMVRWQPIITDTNVSAPVGYVASVHQSSLGTPATILALANKPKRKFVNFGRAWNMDFKMNGVDEATYTLTSATTNNGGVAFYGTGGLASTPLGYYIVEYLVEFRGQF